MKLNMRVLFTVLLTQESHIELLNCLVNDSGIAHTRRVLSSILVYSVLLVFFFWLPIYFLRKAVGEPLRFTVFYLSPRLQMPIEMAICHFVFLSFLEKEKDLIGKFQFSWLKKAGVKLGLQEFLLPMRYTASEV